MDHLQETARNILKILESEHSRELIVPKILGYKGKEGYTRFDLARLLVSYAQQNDNYEVARYALDAFEAMKSRPSRDTELYYDIANGYQVLYELSVKKDISKAFEGKKILKEAIRYFKKAGESDARVLTNFGNLYDYIGRPVEAIECYDLALKADENHGMALGNKALALEQLAPIIARYQNIYLIKAYQLYQQAFRNERSIEEVGGEGALTLFHLHAERLESVFRKASQSSLLLADLTHSHYNEDNLTGFVKFYTDYCLDHSLYLNLHLSDEAADGSIGDSIVPILRTAGGDNELQYVNDIIFRFNEISESYMTSRMALVQSQYANPDFSVISRQTMLVGNRDDSVSNIYIGHLKMAYKEAFSTLDKIAVLINHYLKLETPEENVYYGNVWYEWKDYDSKEEPILHEKIKVEQQLVGLYLLCTDLNGSKYSDLRNALTHRYKRVSLSKENKNSSTFDELTDITLDVISQVRCAIIYLSLFITRKERAKQGGVGPMVDMPLTTNQHLDNW